MMKEDKDIGVLLRDRIIKFEAQDNGSFDFDSEWKAIVPSVKKMNFYKWGFGHFNLYYSVVIFSSLLAFIYFLQRPANEKLSEQAKQVETKLLVQNEMKEDFAYVQENYSKTKEAVIREVDDGGKGKKTSNLDNSDKNDGNIAEINSEGKVSLPSSIGLDQIVEPILSEELKKDTIQPSEVKDQTVPQIVPKAKKVVVLNRQDTIVKIDTVHKIKKKRIFH